MTMNGFGLAPLERAPAYRLVHDAIEREILAGRLRVGDPLPAELRLAEQLGVNRSTVREGIRLLEQSGFVQRLGGRRPRISAPHFQELASSASRALILHAVTFRELWEAAMLLEPATAEMAARNIQPGDIERLADNIKEMRVVVDALDTTESDDQIETFVRLDREFHELIGEASHNRALALAHEPVTTLFIPAGQIILPRLKTYRRVLDAHIGILECLKAMDTDGVRTWMCKHMDDFRRGYELTGLDFDMPLDAARLIK